MNKVFEITEAKKEILINVNKLINNSPFLTKIKMSFEINSTSIVFNYDEPINKLDYRYLRKFWRDIEKLIKSN